jgi:superfamily II DNA/RNA helicase
MTEQKIPEVTFVKVSNGERPQPLFKDSYLEKDVAPPRSEFSEVTRGYHWNQLLSNISWNAERTARIVRDVRQLLDAGRSVLVVADRLKLLKNIYHDLKRTNSAVEYLYGETVRNHKEKVQEKLSAGKIRCLVVSPIIDAAPGLLHNPATRQARFDAIVFTTPTNVKFLSRVERLWPLRDDTVQPVIRYYVDTNAPQAMGCFAGHLRKAEQLGWKVITEEE